MKTQLLDGEALVKEGPANLQRGIESVGGRLFLTTHRVVFESHRFNVQRGATSISLQDVVGVSKCWTKFLGFLPVLPNSIAIETKDGNATRMVMWGRDVWIESIEGARRRHASA